MSQEFVRWIQHRMAMLGITSPEGLADAASLPRESVSGILDPPSLRRAGRSVRSYLARALQVRLRDLEDLIAGRTAWIDDARRYEWDRHAPDFLRAGRVDELALVSCAERVGVPIVGRIEESGFARWIEEPPTDHVERLPLRYPGAPDAFAMRTSRRFDGFDVGGAIIFRSLPPGRITEGDLCLMTFGIESQGVLGSVVGKSDEAARLNVGGAAITISLETVLRAARAIASRRPDETPCKLG